MKTFLGTFLLFTFTAQATVRLSYQPFSAKGFDCGKVRAEVKASCNQWISNFSKAHVLVGQPTCQLNGCYSHQMVEALAVAIIRYDDGQSTTGTQKTRYENFDADGWGCAAATAAATHSLYEWLSVFANKYPVPQGVTKSCYCGGSPMSTATCSLQVSYIE